MGLFNLLQKPASYFFNEEQQHLVAAIRQAEQTTSGEIRVFVEAKNPLVNPLERAREIFYKLEMDETAHRNGVLLYIAHKHHELAIFADEGIYREAGAAYWDKCVQELISTIDRQNICVALQSTIIKLGEILREKFPYEKETDKNELPDDIIFGH